MQFMKVLRVVVWLIIIATFTYEAVKVITTGQRLEQTSSIIDELYNNVSSKPIKEIKLISVNEVKPDTWYEVPGFKFKGMKAYCNCNGKIQTSCKEDDKGCVSISAEKAASMGLWKGSKLVYRTFKKKEVELSHLDKSGKPTCDDGFKLCTNSHCVKSYVKCPISHFWLNKNKEHPVYESDLIEKVDLGDDEVVLVRGSENNRVLNGLSYNLNGMPCTDFGSEHKRASKKASHLNSSYGGNGCTKPFMENVTDFVSIDSYSFLSFLTDNGMRSYVESIPEDELSHMLEDRVHLAGRFGIKFNQIKECLNFDIERINMFSLAIKTMYNIGRIFIIIKIALYVFFAFVSRADFGFKLFWLSVLTLAFTIAHFFIIQISEMAANNFIHDVLNNLYPNK